MAKRAAIYARVSYDDRKNEARNLQGQLEDGRAFCQERGYRIAAELAEDDRGASGASWDLPQLNEALEMARTGEFDILVTRELDRFARSLAKQLVIEGEFKRHGVEVEYILGEYPDTPEGQLNKNIRAVFAEYEREKIRVRMTRARRNVVKSGKVMLHGDRPPYGYRLKGGQLVICEEEAKIVKMIFTWYVYGNGNGKRLSIRAIAMKLTEMRIPTYLDIRENQGGYKNRKYGEWAPDTVSDILGNETYAGTWHYGKRNNSRQDWLPVEVPAIIGREVWESTRKQKRHNKAMAKRNTKYNYLLARRVACGRCGYKMCARTTKGKYGYYTCPTVDAARRGRPCDNRYFNTAQVDAAVWEWVKGLLMHPEKLREDLEEQQAEQEEENKPLWDQLAVVDDLLTQKRAEHERCFQAYVSGKWDEDIALREKAQLDKVIDDLEKRRADLLATLEEQTISDAQIVTITEFAQEMSEGLAAADEDFDARRQIIDLLDVQVTLTVEEGQKVAYVRCLVDEAELPIISPASKTAP